MIGGVARRTAVAMFVLLVLVLFLAVGVATRNTPDGKPIQACAPTAVDPDGLRMPCFR